MKSAIKHALLAGFRAFAAFLLTSALFAAPSLGSHQDLHLHDDGTVHIHPISSLFVFSPPAVTSLYLVFALVFLLTPIGLNLSQRSYYTAYQCRAPPMGILQ